MREQAIAWSGRFDLDRDLLARHQAVGDDLRVSKVLVRQELVGRMDLNHRPPGPEPRFRKILSRFGGVEYGIKTAFLQAS